MREITLFRISTRHPYSRLRRLVTFFCSSKRKVTKEKDAPARRHSFVNSSVVTLRVLAQPGGA